MSQIKSIRAETNLPLNLFLSSSGPVTGATAVVAVRDGATTNSYLDFNDDTFKTSAWTTRQDSLTEGESGVYTLSGGLDLSAMTNLPAGTDHLLVEYEVTAPSTVAGITSDVILIEDEVSANVTSISGDTTAADNLELMYDGTGYTDDTAPSSRAQVGLLSTGSASISVQAESYVLTTGTQSSGTITDTETLNQVYHEHTDTAGVLDLYYEFNVGGNGVGVDINFSGRLNSSNDSVLVYAYNWSGAAWDQVGVLDGRNTSIDSSEQYELLVRNTGAGANIGKIRIRFSAASGLTTATLRVDRLSSAFSIVTQSVGYALGRIWINTNDGIAGNVAFVNGVADNAVLTWADALTISSAVTVTDFQVINGGAISLSGTSDNYSIFGDNYALALGGQSCIDIHIAGASVSGVGTAASGEMHFEGCDIGTASIQNGHYDFCGFSATVTNTLTGDYNYHNCYSKVAGSGAPTFTKTAGQTITSQWRNWAGSMTVSGIEAGDVMTIGGTLGTVTLNGADGTIEIRGTYKGIVDNRTGSPALNTDGAIKGVDVANILVDTNELQIDWVNGGRLDLILDSRMAEASINTTAGAVDVVTLVTTTTTNTDMLAATAIVSNGAITTLSGSVVNVDLVDVTTTNTDQRGTDNAALATALATAQNDLDIITGSTGALLDPTATSLQLVKDIMDRVISKANHNVPGSLAKIVRQGGDLTQIDGAVSDVSPSTTSFGTNLTQADTYFDDSVLIFSNGSVNAGIGRPVSAYLNASGNMTFAAPDDWPVTPVNGDDFVIFATHVHPIAQIQSGLATEPKQDIIDANVDLVLADTNELQADDVPGLIAALNDVAATDIVSAGAITTLAGAVANVDLVDVTTTNSDTVTPPTAAQNRIEMDSNSTQLAAILADTNELQLDDIPGLIAALNDLSSAQVNAEMLDVLTVDTFTELSSIPAAATTLKDMLALLYLTSTNVITQDGNTFTLKNRAGTATIGTAAINKSGVLLTKSKMV